MLRREPRDLRMHRRTGEFTVGDPGRPEEDLEVAPQLGRIVEPVELGPLLDEEVERIDRGEVRDQTHGDPEGGRGFREHQARQIVAERVLLPVQEVLTGVDGERVRLDRCARVRRRTQADDVGVDLGRPVERVHRPMLEGNLDRHRRNSPPGPVITIPAADSIPPLCAMVEISSQMTSRRRVTSTAPGTRWPNSRRPTAFRLRQCSRRPSGRRPSARRPSGRRRPAVRAWRRSPIPCAAAG